MAGGVAPGGEAAAVAELAKARAPEFESVFLDDQPALEARYVNGQLLEPEQGFAEDGRPLGADGKPISRVRWWYRQWADQQQA